MTSQSLAQSKRLFLALWPDQQVVRKIHQHAIKHFSTCQGRIIQKNNWHITLAYFGASDTQTQLCLEEHAEKIKASSFELSLSECGYWKKPAVAWLAPSSIPDALKQLAFDVQQTMIPCGYKPDVRDYQPHVTVVRKAKQPPSVSEIQPIPWYVDKFCLVESITSAEGAQYTILKSWDFNDAEVAKNILL